MASISAFPVLAFIQNLPGLQLSVFYPGSADLIMGQAIVHPFQPKKMVTVFADIDDLVIGFAQLIYDRLIPDIFNQQEISV